MKHICSVIAAIALSGLPALASAAGPTASNHLSVHVLNLQDGLPSPDVDVVLEKQNGTQWGTLNSGVTDAQGRVPALYPEGKKLETGIYRVTFKTGKWFAGQKGATFFPEIPVIFSVDGSVAHYHIPLLLSPYGYATYRGN
jgi:5-hydroxyisourate hydrolase